MAPTCKPNLDPASCPNRDGDDKDVAPSDAVSDNNGWIDAEPDIDEWLILKLAPSEESGLAEEVSLIVRFLGGVVEKNAWRSSFEMAQAARALNPDHVGALTRSLLPCQLADAKRHEAVIGFKKSLNPQPSP